MQKPVASKIPQGVGAPPPPGMDPRKGKLMCIKVRMLDDTIAVFHLGHKATGQALFDEVCRHLNLLESDYFGLEFIDGYGNRCWLDKEKSILRQITNTQSDARFYFVVKFYTPNPADLEEEYLLALQIRRDLARGELVCNENTAALLVSYIVQSDCGDYSHEDYPDHTYLSVRCFIPNQTAQFQMKVMENHKKLVGMSPGEADLALLETARRCDFYGIKLHPAKDIEGTEVNLAVAHTGIKVFHQLQCVSVFSWAKIRKLSFKRRRLMIKLHPESYQYYKETIEFGFETRNEAKNFWKKCVEHHAFFRCIEVIDGKKDSKTKLFSRGSSFKYHGRTQKQLIDYVREHRKRREPFTRPLKPGEAMSRAGSATRHIQFNVIDATKMPPQIYPEGYSSLNRPGSHRSATVSSEDERVVNATGRQPMPNGTHQRSVPGPVYYPPGTSIAQQAGYQQVQPMTTVSNGKNRPKSAYQTSQAPSYASDSERVCISDLESNVAEVYMPQRSLQKPRQESKPREIPQTTTSGTNGSDPMSMSLPNVLGDDIKVVCKEIELYPPKSASGEFLDDVRTRHEFHDDMSEGSYRLADYEKTAQQGNDSSSQSDVGTASSVDPRVYSTTFTTKRIGNVVVKRVTGGKPRRDAGGSGGDDDDSSSYSDYRGGTSISAPTSSRVEESRSTGRHSSQYAALMKPGITKFKDAVPIPIDGPDATPPIVTIAPTHVVTTSAMATVVATSSRPSTGGSTAASNSRSTTGTGSSVSVSSSGASVATIIRPIVLSTDGTPPRGIAPPHRPIVVHPMPSSTESKYTSVYRIRNYDQGSSVSTFRSFISTSPKESSIGAQEREQKRRSTPESGTGPSSRAGSSSGPVTYGASKPLPGKIIHKDNMVITPSGIVAKEEIIAMKKSEKPAVPPKPKGLVSKVRIVAEATIPAPAPPVHIPITKPEPVKSPSASNQPPQPPPKPKPQPHPPEPQDKPSTSKPDVDELLAPLDSILNDAQDLSSILSTGKKPRERPTLISVESVDEPEVRKIHLLNGKIPYTLTIRQTPGSSGSDPSSSLPLEALLSGDETKYKIQDDFDVLREQSKRNFMALEKRKSLDLVPRNRLPSVDSFSSIDHSISPTDPNSGNIIEYLERRRSMSSDKYPLSGLSAVKRSDRRADPRRQTQPVRFVTKEVPETSKAYMSSMPQVSPLEVEEKVEIKKKSEAGQKVPLESKQSEEEQSEEMPAPPPPLDLVKLAVSGNIKAIDESSPETSDKSPEELKVQSKYDIPKPEERPSTSTLSKPTEPPKEELLKQSPPKAELSEPQLPLEPPEAEPPLESLKTEPSKLEPHKPDETSRKPSTSRTEKGVLETDF